jgi:LPXTG-motif cell wall-anchored protein
MNCASLEILPTTENRDMKTLVIPVALLLALSVPALAQKGTIGDKPPSSGVKGAPGPLVGAGLPVLLIGGGIYWLVRRRKRA